jgi:hypothetical protein
MSNEEALPDYEEEEEQENETKVNDHKEIKKWVKNEEINSKMPL